MEEDIVYFADKNYECLDFFSTKNNTFTFYNFLKRAIDMYLCVLQMKQAFGFDLCFVSLKSTTCSQKFTEKLL